jgi:hypothetical protein
VSLVGLAAELAEAVVLDPRLVLLLQDAVGRVLGHPAAADLDEAAGGHELVAREPEAVDLLEAQGLRASAWSGSRTRTLR